MRMVSHSECVYVCIVLRRTYYLTVTTRRRQQPLRAVQCAGEAGFTVTVIAVLLFRGVLLHDQSRKHVSRHHGREH